MALIQISGPVKSKTFLKTASTAIAIGQGLEFNSGKVDPAQASTLVLAGFSCRAVASTDSDYASSNAVLVNTPHDEAVYLADVITGTAAATNVGVAYDFNSTATGIDLTGTTYKQLLVVGVIDSTHVLVKVNEAVVTAA